MIVSQEEVESDDDMPGLEEKSMPPKTYEDENVTDDESDVELDNEGVVESDVEPPQKASRYCSHPYSINYCIESAGPLVSCDSIPISFLLGCKDVLVISVGLCLLWLSQF